jgi:4-diphosphocytidyl-2-C-methyl-D-erythritol kinase
VILFSNAKINIGLQIKGKRHDSYYNLESIFYPIPLHDLIEIKIAQTDTFSQSGIEIDPINNLIVSAVGLLHKDFDFPPIHIHLHKQIPLGSGLGGGSSNATCVLKGLNDLFNFNIGETEMQEYALNLGSDCPFFIQNKVSLVKGRGEIINPIDFSLAGKFIHLIYPDIHISTAEAFESMERSISTHINLAETANWLAFKNDFEFGAVIGHTEVGKYINVLKKSGSIFTSLSGTGSSVYGIFNSKPETLKGVSNWVFELE